MLVADRRLTCRSRRLLRSFGADGNVSCSGTAVKDLWQDNGPAPPELLNRETCSDRRQDGCVYEDALLVARVRTLLFELARSRGSKSAAPWLLVWSPHLIHGPLQVPRHRLALHGYTEKRDVMLRLLDDYVADVVSLVGDLGLWQQTLVVFASDNGGEKPGSNAPLSGYKFSNWEGGVRTPAFLAGGALPAAVHGARYPNLITIWDWYATLVVGLAGASPSDALAESAGLPGLDSVDAWPALSGSSSTRPRATVLLGGSTGDHTKVGRVRGRPYVGGVVSQPADWGGRIYKLLLGDPSLNYSLASPQDNRGREGSRMRGVSAEALKRVSCGSSPKTGCLFELTTDPSEAHNVAPVEPATFHRLVAQARRAEMTAYDPNLNRTHANRGGSPAERCRAYLAWGGFIGPHRRPSASREGEQNAT